MTTRVSPTIASFSSLSSPKPRSSQAIATTTHDHEAGEQHDAAGDQAVLEPQPVAHAVESGSCSPR